jgi:uncharacterized protein YcbK (DUF882 family)
VHVGDARLNSRRLSVARAGYSCGLALLAFLLGSRALQNAVAEGDTRTITMHHMHTGEDITITYKRDGQYDEAALEKLNWFLRDWRRGEKTQMDPRLIDLVWEVQRDAGAKEPIQVVCGYRSPQTNEMLRHRSTGSGVARYSQHMLGRAMDFFIPAVPLEQLREYGLRLARGGVGFYPESGSPFVHMDVGGIRMWPRMTHEELARVFPDGRTVQIPTDGKPLSGYALALADIRRRGSMPSETSLAAARDAGVAVDTLAASNDRPAANPFAKLFGLLPSDDENEDADATPATAVALASAPARPPSKPVALAGLAPSPDNKPAASIAAVPAKVAAAIAKLPLVHIAKLVAPPAPAAPAAPAAPVKITLAALTPNQVIVTRGYWQGPADATAPANPLANAAVQRRATAASADADATGSIGPFANPHGDTPGIVLAYADQSGSDTAAAPDAPTGIDALRAAAVPALQAPQIGTTVAVKRAANQVASAVITASASSIAVIKADVRFDNPWLRAIVLSPSVHRFLTTAALGARDFTSLAALMVKPRNAVMMTFAADPNPGLDHDRFSGAAIVFVSTVSYPTRSAALQ